MFEKEAEEYSVGKAHEHYNYLFEEHAGSPVDFARWCFQDGAEFGYNKANEWKYTENGDLPKEHGWYCVQYNNGTFDCLIVTNSLRFLDHHYSDVTDCIYAWKEIVPPSDKENK